MDIVTNLQTALQTADIHRISSLSGVSVPAIYKIRSGDTPNPGVKTVEALMSALGLDLCECECK